MAIAESKGQLVHVFIMYRVRVSINEPRTRNPAPRVLPAIHGERTRTNRFSRLGLAFVSCLGNLSKGRLLWSFLAFGCGTQAVGYSTSFLTKGSKSWISIPKGKSRRLLAGMLRRGADTDAAARILPEDIWEDIDMDKGVESHGKPEG